MGQSKTVEPSQMALPCGTNVQNLIKVGKTEYESENLNNKRCATIPDFEESQRILQTTLQQQNERTLDNQFMEYRIHCRQVIYKNIVKSATSQKTGITFICPTSNALFENISIDMVYVSSSHKCIGLISIADQGTKERACNELASAKDKLISALPLMAINYIPMIKVLVLEQSENKPTECTEKGKNEKECDMITITENQFSKENYDFGKEIYGGVPQAKLKKVRNIEKFIYFLTGIAKVKLETDKILFSFTLQFNVLPPVFQKAIEYVKYEKVYKVFWPFTLTCCFIFI